MSFFGDDDKVEKKILAEENQETVLITNLSAVLNRFIQDTNRHFSELKATLVTIMGSQNTLADQLKQADSDISAALKSLADADQNLATVVQDNTQQTAKTLADFQAQLSGLVSQGTVPQSVVADFSGMAALINANAKQVTDAAQAITQASSSLKQADPGIPAPAPVS